MNHPYFTGQAVADRQADLIEQAHRDRLFRRAGDAQVTGDGGASRHRASWPRRQPGVGVQVKRSPLALVNLLLATAALTVAVVAIVTDEASSGLAPPVVTPREVTNPVVAPDDPRPPAEEVSGADQPQRDSLDQPRLPQADAPAGDCLVRRVVVRC